MGHIYHERPLLRKDLSFLSIRIQEFAIFIADYPPPPYQSIMKQHPIIGIPLDSEQPGGYSKLPWYALRQNYAESVARAGGVAIFLPHHPNDAETYLGVIDGLLIAGGAFDVDPALFGESERHETVVLKADRTRFEQAMVSGALARDMPILGICGGEQLLAVLLGGTLIQHIPDSVPDALAHEQPNPRTEPGHEVAVVAGSQLHRIVGAERVPVNSAHHQAVRSVGEGCLVTAVADDGVIEAFEQPSRRFCIGVQWHPEYAISPADDRLMTAFVEACR